MVAELAGALARWGGQVRLEHPVWHGRVVGYADCCADLPAGRFVIEVENEGRRIKQALKKARLIGAERLWIVTANGRVARQVRRRLAALVSTTRAFTEPRVEVLTFGQARRRLCHGNPPWTAIPEVCQ